MAYFDSSFGIANPLSFSPRQGAPASVEDDSNMQSGHLDCIGPILDCLEGRFSYDDYILPHNTNGFQPESGSSTTVDTGNMSTNSAYPEGLTATSASESASAPALPSFANYDAYTHDFDFLLESLDWDSSALLTPALTNASSIPSPSTDGIGDQMNLPHTHEAPAPNFVSPLDLSLDFSIPGNFQAEQVSHAPSHWDGIGFTPQTQRDDVLASAPEGMSENVSCVYFTTLALLTGEERAPS
ncbi:hypothetical protein BJY52DRAFT_1191718 [Lactarius psammicola]|nr:hypothetical protein BJY52DRAFT_1191718 [Lactarius psammicola]